MKLLKLKRNLLFGAAILVAAGAMMSRFSTPGNVAQTSANHRDPKLRTRAYATSAQNVAREIKAILPGLRTYGGAWKNTRTSTRIDGDSTKIEMRCEVPVLFFTDDLVISIDGTGERENARRNADKGAQKTSVNIRSASRVGKSDMGENRRHILQILQLLDKNLQ